MIDKKIKIDNTYLLILFIVIEIILFSFLNGNFLTINNFLNIFEMISIDLLLAIGLTFVISTGNIDLSVGSIIAVSGMICAYYLKVSDNLLVSILLGIVGGICLGLINGIIVSILQINSFIGTLSTMSIFRGIVIVLSKGQPIYGFSSKLSSLFSYKLLGLKLITFISLLILIIFYFISNYTRWGLYTKAYGSNNKSLVRLGINDKKVIIKVYCLSAFLASISGILITARLNTAEPLAGFGYEMNAIAATVLGGTYINGGNNKLSGTALACLALGILSNGLVMISVSSRYQQLITGIILLVAMILTKKKDD